MILMSESLTDRIDLEQDEDAVEATQPADERLPQLQDQKAYVQFCISGEVISCSVRKMSLASDRVSITFVSVPSLPLRLREHAPVSCILSCGTHVLDFDLHSFEATWDNMEGKQLCTIISKIEQHARSSE